MSTGGSSRMDEARLEAVLRRAREGDAGAFAELYQAFSRRVRGLCRHLLGPEGADDATNEVFLKAQRAMSSYDTALPFPRWLLSVAAHHCIDLLRRRRVEARLFAAEETAGPEPVALGPSPLAGVLSEEKRAAVRAAVEGLPARYRAPLALRYYSDMSYDEIATALQISRNQVAILIFRGKKELRRALAARKEYLV